MEEQIHADWWESAESWLGLDVASWLDSGLFSASPAVDPPQPPQPPTPPSPALQGGGRFEARTIGRNQRTPWETLHILMDDEAVMLAIMAIANRGRK